ncbi:hypothetical protein FHS16_001789 [Paenibacillus endophyticus]|uniref:DUF1697 domain-containing protein n=1 Tax=Paenibacillus endophyticus TaxID=1294268 RepID=A0A7W5C5X1_9BACL|nr:DUF1697 domain-containing protein [Paenibacillus endophyticus]MBB3151743.1 hypothetical protein [Paenibacillus endophyticus]
MASRINRWKKPSNDYLFCLLRGINVSGHHLINMSELREIGKRF